MKYPSVSKEIPQNVVAFGQTEIDGITVYFDKNLETVREVTVSTDDFVSFSVLEVKITKY